MRAFLKSIIPFIIQFFILCLCFITIDKLTTLPTTFLFIVKFFSYIVLSLGMLLSIWFNRGKVFFINSFLIISQLLILNYPVFSINTLNFSRFLFPALGIAIPLNILLLCQLKERGIFSLWGKLKILFIVTETFFIYQITISKDLHKMLSSNFVTWLLGSGKISNSPLILAVYSLAIIFLIIKIIINKSDNEKRMLGVIIFTFLSLLNIDNKLIFSIFLSGAGLTLFIGIIEDSYLMAYMDELTGIPARRAMRETLMKLGNKYVIAMLDIDFFKKFNDTYGHDIGDEVLKLVATNLKTITGGGKVFRYGGEEFTIVFSGKTMAEVIPHVEKLREQISKASYTKKSSSRSKTKRSTSKKLSVTISIGVAEKNQKNKTTNDVMKAADNALYRAKKKGRNCVSR